MPASTNSDHTLTSKGQDTCPSPSAVRWCDHRRQGGLRAGARRSRASPAQKTEHEDRRLAAFLGCWKRTSARAGRRKHCP